MDRLNDNVILKNDMASIIDILLKNKGKKDLSKDMKIYFANLVELWKLSKYMFHDDKEFVAKHQSMLTKVECQLASYAKLIRTDLANWDIKKFAKDMQNTKYEISWMRRDWSNWKSS